MNDEITNSPDAADMELPVCRERPGCFAEKDGSCTALKASPLPPCSFFRTTEDHRKGTARAFYRLVDWGRFDLIRRYMEEYRDLGCFVTEIRQAEKHRTVIETYTETNLVELREYYARNPFIEQGADQYQELDDLEYDAGDGDDTIDEAAIAAVDEDEPSDDEGEEKGDGDFPDNIDDNGIRELENLAQGVEDDIIDAENTDVSNGEDDADTAYNPEIYTESRELPTRENDISSYDDEDPDLAESRLISALISLLPPPKPVRINWSFERTYGMFAAEIIYKAAEEYTLILRKLWSGKYGSPDLENLIIGKWEAESFFGSHLYWQLTNINPERIMDQCERNAMREAKEAAVRRNRRIIAGVDQVYDEQFVDKWRRDRLAQKKTQRLKLS